MNTKVSEVNLPTIIKLLIYLQGIIIFSLMLKLVGLPGFARNFVLSLSLYLSIPVSLYLSVSLFLYLSLSPPHPLSVQMRNSLF